MHPDLTRETSAVVALVIDDLASLARSIRQESGRVAAGAWRIGSLLAEAREKTGAAALTVWAQEELQLSRATAYRYLSIFEAFPDPAVLERSGVSMRVLYRLAGSPEEVRDELTERLEEGEKLTEDDVRAARGEDLSAPAGVTLERSAEERRQKALQGDRCFTPEDLVELARDLMGGIELDPATEPQAQRVVRADRFFTKHDNGLQQDWVARTLFLNPPYSKEAGGVGEWVDKLLDAVGNGHVQQAVIVTKSKTETGWYKRLGEFFWRAQIWGRVAFVRPEGVEDHGAGWDGTSLSYFGPHEARFVEKLKERSDILPPRHWLEAALEDAARPQPELRLEGPAPEEVER